MDIRSLRYFLAVVDHGGVTRGAAALFVSQPSLSQTIRQLEAELGVQLLDRSGPSAQPTGAGRELADLARRVLNESERARERVHRVADLSVGRVVAATASTFGVYPLTPIVARLRQLHPGLEVHILDAGTGPEVLARIERHTAEIGVVELPVDDARWGVHRLPREEIVVATPGVATDAPIPRDDIPQLALGVATADADSSTELGALLGKQSGRARVRTTNRQLLWELVLAGSVATLLGRRSAQQLLPGVTLRSLDPPLWRTPGLIWRNGALSPAGTALLAAAEVFGGEIDEGAGDRTEPAGFEDQTDVLPETIR